MNAVRWFSQEELRAVERLVDDLGQPGDGWDDPAATLRDGTGTYWRRERARWLVRSDDAWTDAGTPTESLEGPALYALLADEGNLPARPKKPERRSADGVAFLEAAASDVRQAYERGEISSEDGDRLLVSHVVVDGDGVLWLPGCRSGSWYAFQDGTWARVERRPDPRSLVEPRVEAPACPSCGNVADDGSFCPVCGTELPEQAIVWPEAAEKAVAVFLNGEALPPEPVSDPWHPPQAASSVERTPQEEDVSAQVLSGRTCPGCGVSVGPDDAFCRTCGHPVSISGGFCPSCGSRAEPGDTFCGSCGAGLTT